MNPVMPSILTTNFFDLESKLTEFRNAGIDHLHLDVMDGHFVENMAFGPSAVKALKSRFDFAVDAHLMVDNPSRVVPWFIEAGADCISIHIETNDRIGENLELIRNNGRKCGLVLNPDTDVNKIDPYLKDLNYILLMSVFPGYGGQSFIEETYRRIATVKEKTESMNSECLIQVDGGVKSENIDKVAEAGADLFVVGTYLYNASDAEKTVQMLLERAGRS